MRGVNNVKIRKFLVVKNYLVEKLVTSPQNVLAEMPSSIGEQFQGEWALYSCSMLSAALVNLSYLYPDTKKENILYVPTFRKDKNVDLSEILKYSPKPPHTPNNTRFVLDLNNMTLELQRKKSSK